MEKGEEVVGDKTGILTYLIGSGPAAWDWKKTHIHTNVLPVL
jgi:hypothetical protein